MEDTAPLEAFSSAIDKRLASSPLDERLVFFFGLSQRFP
jgi:hypothetical protein